MNYYNEPTRRGWSWFLLHRHSHCHVGTEPIVRWRRRNWSCRVVSANEGTCQFSSILSIFMPIIAYDTRGRFRRLSGVAKARGVVRFVWNCDEFIDIWHNLDLSVIGLFISFWILFIIRTGSDRSGSVSSVNQIISVSVNILVHSFVLTLLPCLVLILGQF